MRMLRRIISDIFVFFVFTSIIVCPEYTPAIEAVPVLTIEAPDVSLSISSGPNNGLFVWSRLGRAGLTPRWITNKVSFRFSCPYGVARSLWIRTEEGPDSAGHTVNLDRGRSMVTEELYLWQAPDFASLCRKPGTYPIESVVRASLTCEGMAPIQTDRRLKTQIICEDQASGERYSDYDYRHGYRELPLGNGVRESESAQPQIPFLQGLVTPGDIKTGEETEIQFSPGFVSRILSPHPELLQWVKLDEKGNVERIIAKCPLLVNGYGETQFECGLKTRLKSDVESRWELALEALYRDGTSLLTKTVELEFLDKEGMDRKRAEFAQEQEETDDCFKKIRKMLENVPRKDLTPEECNGLGGHIESPALVCGINLPAPVICNEGRPQGAVSGMACSCFCCK